MEAVKKLRRNSEDRSESENDSEGHSGSEGEERLSAFDLDSGDESDSDVDPNLEFQVEFEAKSIEEGDFHGIRQLLKQLFLKSNVDLSALTDYIISQSSLYGSTIKVAIEEGQERERGKEGEGEGKEEENGEEIEECDVCGISTFVPLVPNQSFVKQLKDHLISTCEAHSTETNCKVLGEMLQKSTSLLVNEKVLNLPVQIGALALRTLLNELNKAVATPGVWELVVIIARSHLVLSADIGQKRKGMDDLTIPQKEELTFDFYENEFLLKESLLSFSYPVSEEKSEEVFGGWDDSNVKLFRTVLILPYSKLEPAISALEKSLKES